MCANVVWVLVVAAVLHYHQYIQKEDFLFVCLIICLFPGNYFSD